ncbi:MAG: exonuclease subunit SbcD [Desulfovibrionaceae bacterium]|nr:exonuclease subunit SbcD [Desulfovibrionaceae bacterium]
MKVLHTSDLHLGHTLHDRPRLDEQRRLLQWLVELILERRIEVLVVSGDIYHTCSPMQAACQLLFEFLRELRQRAPFLRAVILTGGNHDSPSVLNSPSGYLNLDGIRVLGRASQDPSSEVIPVTDEEGRVRLIVCAVPYVREMDLPRSAFSDDLNNRESELARGTMVHIEAVREKALELEKTLDEPVPLLAMAHLFAQGVSLKEEKDRDGESIRVREEKDDESISADGDRDGESRSVGGQGLADAAPLVSGFDYAALGHIHGAQRVAGSDHVRYSGSPLAMDFGERRHEKKVLIVNLEDDASAAPSPASGWKGHVDIEEVPVPAFRRLLRLQGDSLDKLREEVAAKAEEERQAGREFQSWVYLEYTGKRLVPGWTDTLKDACMPEGGGSAPITFAKIVDRSPVPGVTLRLGVDLEKVQPHEIFDMYLKDLAISSDDERQELRGTFAELVSLNELSPEDRAMYYSRMENTSEVISDAGPAADAADRPAD